MTWGGIILFVTLVIAVLTGWWLVHGWYVSHKAQIPGFWGKLLAAFDDSITKVFAHFVALVSSLSVATPEVLTLLGDNQGSSVIRQYWPEYAGGILLLVAIGTIICRNRGLFMRESQ